MLSLGGGWSHGEHRKYSSRENEALQREKVPGQRKQRPAAKRDSSVSRVRGDSAPRGSDTSAPLSIERELPSDSLSRNVQTSNGLGKLQTVTSSGEDQFTCWIMQEGMAPSPLSRCAYLPGQYRLIKFYLCY